MRTSWLKAAPLLALNVVFWFAYAAVTGALWCIGAVVIPQSAKDRWWITESRVWPGRIIKRWAHGRDWMNPVWGNEQEGIDGLPLNHPPSVTNWPSRQFKSDSERTVEWSMRRNSTNNLRFMHYFVPWLGWINPKTIEPARIRWVGADAPLDSVLATVNLGENAVGTYYRRRFACLFVSQGLYAGLKIAVRFRGRAHQIWFGWKLNAGMAVEGWWPEDPCWKGVGFTCGQVRHTP